MRRLLLFPFLIPSSLAAATCEELWFTRNAAFHQSGYCFTSPLGRAVFGTANCPAGEVSLSERNRRVVDLVSEREELWSCAIDTGATTLDIAPVTYRLTLADLPVPAEGESACIGWQGEPVPLSEGYRPEGEISVVIEPGDTVLLNWLPLDGYDYFEVYDGERLKGGGWITQGALRFDLCEMFAG